MCFKENKMEKVLIIDNKEGWRSAFSGVIEDEGCRAIAVHNETEGVNVLKSCDDIALILFGCNKPIKDYESFIKLINAKYPSVPLVYLGDCSPERTMAEIVTDTVTDTVISYEKLSGFVEKYCR